MQDNSLNFQLVPLDFYTVLAQQQWGEDLLFGCEDVKHFAQCKDGNLALPPQVYRNPHNKPARK